MDRGLGISDGSILDGGSSCLDGRGYVRQSLLDRRETWVRVIGEYLRFLSPP
jgi:hypothetical protein